ncbi:MAG: hypothetical protein ABIF19_05950 [Planctomycetota bacterium]
MKTTPIILTVVVAVILSGCEGLAGKRNPSGEGREFLTLDFRQGQTLRYRFVSARDVIIDLGATKQTPRSGGATTDKISESMELIVAYTPVEIDPYGPTTIKATCESVKVTRTKGPRRDAVQSLAGRTFTLVVGPTGRIEDYSQLDELIREIGEKVFRYDDKGGRIKDPDMIGDFVAGQWFLWDAVSSIEQPSKGVQTGQSWKSKLPVPAPMVMRKARDVTYTLDEVQPSEKGRLAVISSSYQPAESAPRSWPIPYSGSFQVAGTFGFYRNYQVLDLQGRGEELFNIDAGRTEQHEQHYEMRLKCSMLLPLPGVNPVITIKQNLTMKLLED